MQSLTDYPNSELPCQNRTTQHGESVDVRVRLKGINTVTRRRVDGSTALYHYFRATGQRIEGEPGTPEFVANYAKAEQARADRVRASRVLDSTFAGLIRRFEGSPEFDEMRESTRIEYRRKFRAIDREWGDCPISAVTDKDFRRDVLVWRDTIAKKTRREADNLVSSMSRVLAFGVDRGEIDRNVLTQVRRVYRSNRADKIWLPEHVEAFLRIAAPEMRFALTLAIQTGQRQADLLAMPWSAYDGVRISLRQAKTARLVSIKCTAALKIMLDGMTKRGPLILTTSTGRAWKKRYFSEQWDETCKAAGITDLHFHDLRGTAITLLAEAGATVPEIAAVTGHNLATANHILDVYLSRTRALADAAIIKFDAHSNRLQSDPK